MPPSKDLWGLGVTEQGGIGLIFLCRHVSGDPTPDGFEVDGARFFSLDEMDSLTEPIEPWCEWLVRRVLSGRYRGSPKSLTIRIIRSWHICN